MHLGERARPHFAFFLGGSLSLYWGNHLGNRSTRSELALLMRCRCSSMQETALTTHLELNLELRAHSGEVARHAGGVATHVTLCLPTNPFPPFINHAPSLTAPIALKLSKNIEQWSYNMTPANQDTAMSISPSITPKPYYSSLSISRVKTLRVCVGTLGSNKAHPQWGLVLSHLPRNIE